ncbi:MAG: hypothetical protein K0S15_2286 [Solirubrobacterales bacterium]|nr:hypothetical protein [Solirubrobacterales bacterium]
MTVAEPGKNAKILSPPLDALRAGGKARVAIRVGPDRTWRVRVTDRERGAEVSDEFHRVRPRVWEARLGRSQGLQEGANRIWLLTRRGSGDWKATGRRFVFGIDERDLVRLHGPRGRTTATRARIRIESRKEPEHLQVSLNGKRVEGELHKPREGDHRGALSASHGLRYGENHLTVRAYHPDGGFEVERLAFEVARRHPLAAAGRDRHLIEGHALRLNGMRSRATEELKRLRYRWRVARSPLGSKPRLRHAHRPRPLLRTDVHGTYRLRLTVTQSGSGKAHAKAAPGGQSSTDEVTVAAQVDAPPIGVPIQTLADPRGTPTVCPPSQAPSSDGPGVVVGDQFYRAAGDEPIQLLVLNTATLECLQSTGWDQTPTSLGQLLKTVQGLTTDPAKTVAITSSGTQIAQTALATVNNTLKLVGAEPLSASAVDEPFSVIGSLDGKLGTATANPGLDAQTNPASPGWPSGRGLDLNPGALLGFMTLSAEGSTYSFVSPEHVPFTTRDPDTGGPCVEPLDQTACAGYTLEPPATGGFALLELDAGTASGGTASVWPTNGTGEDLQAQQAFAQRLAQDAADPKTIVLIQSIGRPAATTPAWSLYSKGELTGIAAQIVKLGGTADVFNRLDGTISYSLVGGAGIQGPTAEMASGLPVPCIESATWPECQGQKIGDVVMHATRSPSQLTGLLAKNNNSTYQAIVGGVSGDATNPDDVTGFNHALLQVAYQDPEPGGWPFANETDALKYVAQNVVCEKACTLDDPRQAYYDNAFSSWGDKVNAVASLCYPWDADCNPPRGYKPPSPQPTFDSTIFTQLKGQLAKEFKYVSAVQGFLGAPGSIAGSTLQKIYAADSPQIDIPAIQNQIENVSTSSDDQAASEAWQIMAVAASVAGELLTPAAEEGEIDALGLLSDGYWLGAAIAPGGEGAGAFSALETEAAQLGHTLATQLQDQAEQLGVVGQIIVSDWGKLSAVGGPLQQPVAPAWDINEAAALDSLKLSTTQQIYAALMPAVYEAYQLESAGGRGSNATGTDPWHYRQGRCDENVVAYGEPFNYDESGHSEPRTGAFPMVYDIGGTQSSPKRTAHWWAWGTGRLYTEGSPPRPQPDFHVPSANLTDPLFAPLNGSNSNWGSPGHTGLAMFPSWFWTRTWPQPKVLSC